MNTATHTIRSNTTAFIQLGRGLRVTVDEALDVTLIEKRRDGWIVEGVWEGTLVELRVPASSVTAKEVLSDEARRELSGEHTERIEAIWRDGRLGHQERSVELGREARRHAKARVEVRAEANRVVGPEVLEEKRAEVEFARETIADFEVDEYEGLTDEDLEILMEVAPAWRAYPAGNTVTVRSMTDPSKSYDLLLAPGGKEARACDCLDRQCRKRRCKHAPVAELVGMWWKAAAALIADGWAVQQIAQRWTNTARRFGVGTAILKMAAKAGVYHLFTASETHPNTHSKSTCGIEVDRRRRHNPRHQDAPDHTPTPRDSHQGSAPLARSVQPRGRLQGRSRAAHLAHPRDRPASVPTGI